MTTKDKRAPTQREYCDAVINLVQTVNPHTTNEGRKGYVYASGFLAAYLASLMAEDPYIYKRFERHVNALKGHD